MTGNGPGVLAGDRRCGGFVIAAPRSGAGKTTIALGIMRALTRRGLAVQPFKCGPDYIDPAFHAAATGRPSFNLDTWSMRPPLIANLIADACRDADIVVAEGVMGLFDGAAADGQFRRGATADLAALTGWPVVLVLDVSGQTETAAAVALGCRLFRDDIRIAGVIVNRTASVRHLALIRPAFERVGIELFGSVTRRDGLSLPERHLGLVQAMEHGDLDRHLNGLADAVSEHCDLDRLIAAACPASIAPREGAARAIAAIAPPGQRVAVAQDRAFAFMYPHVLAGWRSAGAEIVPFSPLADEAPDATADAVWLPGGYPELHAGELAANAGFLGGLRRRANAGVPVHGECGGYMVLGAGLVDADGARHAMAGLLGLETSFAARRLHLGYRRARILAGGALGQAGAEVFGHEFHYASVLSAPDEPLLDVRDARGEGIAERGGRQGSVTGSFLHAIDCP